MDAVNESFFDSWLKLSTTLDDIQIDTGLTRNETQICYALFRQSKKNPRVFLTPTDISRQTKIRKSQVNRNLNQLEEKGIVTREHSTVDRRKVYVHFDERNADAFFKSYRIVLAFVDRLVEMFGQDEVEHLIDVMSMVNELAEGKPSQEDTGSGA